MTHDDALYEAIYEELAQIVSEERAKPENREYVDSLGEVPVRYDIDIEYVARRTADAVASMDR